MHTCMHTHNHHEYNACYRNLANIFWCLLLCHGTYSWFYMCCPLVWKEWACTKFFHLGSPNRWSSLPAKSSEVMLSTYGNPWSIWSNKFSQPHTFFVLKIKQSKNNNNKTSVTTCRAFPNFSKVRGKFYSFCLLS